MKRAVRTVGNQITVPGFRKGKAPRVMIEQLYGPDVFTEEANQILMTDLYRQALEKEDIVPVGDPEKVDIASTDPFTFTVVVPVFPEVDPGNYRSEEHTSDSSHVRISYAVFCLKKKKQ